MESESVSPANLKKRTLAIASFILIDTIVMGGVAMYLVHGHFAGQDEQKANLMAMIVAAVTTVMAAAIAIFIAKRLGRVKELAALAGAGLLTAAALVRFEGFSGEMAPQFQWRFGNRPPPLADFESSAGPRPAAMTPKPDAGESLGESSRMISPPAREFSTDDDSTDNTSDASSAYESTNQSTNQSAAASDPTADASFVQFLGPNQNGVIGRRQFRVPTMIDDVQTRWRIGVGEGWSSFAVDRGLAITMEQRGDQECVTAYRLIDGEPVWIHRVAARHENALGGIGPRTTPRIDGARVYTQGATGVVVCLEFETGEMVWQVDLVPLGGWDLAASEAALPWGRSASPLVVQNEAIGSEESADAKLVVLPLGGPETANPETAGPDSADDVGRALIALDAASGREVWRTGPEQISFASPVEMTLGGQRQIVSVNEGTVTGHQIETGRRLWSFDWPGRSLTGPSCASAVPAGPNQFLLGKGYGGGSSLARVIRDGDQWSTEEIWHSNRLLKTKFNHTVVRNNIGYGIGNGSIEAVELAESDWADLADSESTVPRRLWRGKRSGRVGQGQLLLADDVIIAQAESGEVRFIAADPNQYDERFVLPALSSKTWNIPTLAGRFLLVRNDREAICFELPPR